MNGTNHDINKRTTKELGEVKQILNYIEMSPKINNYRKKSLALKSHKDIPDLYNNNENIIYQDNDEIENDIALSLNVAEAEAIEDELIRDEFGDWYITFSLTGEEKRSSVLLSCAELLSLLLSFRPNRKKINRDFTKHVKGKVTFDLEGNLEFSGNPYERTQSMQSEHSNSNSPTKQMSSPSMPQVKNNLILKSSTQKIPSSKFISPVKDTLGSELSNKNKNVTYLVGEQEEFNKLETSLPQDSFCSGFFISSLPYTDSTIIEGTEGRQSNCKHKECSCMPAYNPHIHYSHKKEDNTKLEISNEVCKLISSIIYITLIIYSISFILKYKT